MSDLKKFYELFKNNYENIESEEVNNNLKRIKSQEEEYASARKEARELYREELQKIKFGEENDLLDLKIKEIIRKRKIKKLLNEPSPKSKKRNRKSRKENREK